MMKRAVVVGLGITGRAVTEALTRRGVDVVAIDDSPHPDLTDWATNFGIEVHTPEPSDLAALMAGADVVLPAPGVPEHHRVFAAAADAGLPILSEFDLASQWDDRPVVAVTGTDGKTTVVTMIEQMLTASFKASIAVGNTDVPFVAAVEDEQWDVFVVEASSFRLGHSRRFVPDVATWLNFGPDHLDAHASIDTYAAAKASIWKHMTATGVAIANQDDPVVMSFAGQLPAAQMQTFSLTVDAPHRLDGDLLIVDGAPLMERGDLARDLPHDVANTLAAAASAIAAGATREAVAEVARSFEGLPHRVELVATIDNVRYINDSKATTPHAAMAAISSFESIVLIAGGRNKGLDLASLAEESDRVRHVIAIGDAARDVLDVFAGQVESTTATSMEVAVQTAHDLASPGDVVLLSPACASFDWYGSYRERGVHFSNIVRALQSRASISEGPSS